VSKNGTSRGSGRSDYEW